MPLTGEAKREYQRVYMRGYAQAKTKRGVVAAVRDALGVRLPGKPVQVSEAAKQVLAETLRSKSLDLDKIITTVHDSLAAERPYGKDAISGPDNDARLRACDIGLRLHERAGTIPTVAQPAGGAGGLHYHLHLTELAQPERLIPALDAAPDADPRVLDAQVLDSSDDA